MAVGLGASCFEMHFTLDNDLPGPDHWFSENPHGLQKWVDSIRLAHRMMGRAIVRPTQSELAMRTLARRSVVVLKDIKQGKKFTPDNIGSRRPGNGLSPAWYTTVLKYYANSDLKRGNALELGDIK